MDNQTKRALKSDSFITATRSGLGWADEHRSTVYLGAAAAVLVVLLIVGGYFFNQHRNDLASVEFGSAMDTYNAQITTPGEPAAPGVKTYATSADRARAAAAQFVAVAKSYPFTTTANNARYFAGLTYMDAGDNANAETYLKSTAGSWCRDLSNLGKTALATLYHQTGRDPAAIDLLKQVVAKPSSTVSANAAKLQLAALYDASNQHDAANQIYADLKDKDKDGMAGRIASGKLAPVTPAH